MKEKSLKWNAIFNGILKASLIILPLITFPYITRTVHPENYGKLSFCYSIVTYFDLFAALGISSYAIREGATFRKDRQKINKFVSEVYTINIISTMISYGLFVVMLMIWKPEKDYLILLLIYSLEILATTISVEWIYNIYEEYCFILIRTLVLQVVKIVMIFILIKKAKDYYLSAVIDSTFFLLIGFINWFKARQFVNIKIVFSKSLKRHIKPILILFANTVMISIYVNSDITMLGIMQSDSITGVYKVAAKIYSAVKSLINGITIVTIPRLAKYIGDNKKNDYDALLNKIISILMVIIVPVCTGLMLTSRDIILIVSGVEYLSGVVALMILSMTLLVAMFSNILLNAVLIVFKREKFALKTTSISSTVNIILNLGFIPFLSLNGAAITTFISEFLVMIMAYWYSKDLLNLSINWRIFKNIAVGDILIICICVFVSYLKLNICWSLLIKVLLSSLIYGCVMLFNKDFRTLVKWSNIDA